MANVIDIVMRGHDQATAQLKLVSKELSVVGGSLGSIQPLAAQAAGSIGGLTGSLGALAASAGPVALVAGSIVALGTASFNAARKLADMAEQTGLLASETGLSFENVQVLEKTLGVMGLRGDAATQALSFFNQRLAEGGPLVKALGLDTHDTYTALQQLSRAFAESNDIQLKTRIATELLGRGGRSLAGIFGELDRQMAETRSTMLSMGGIMDEDLRAKALELDRQIDQLRLAWGAAWLEMLRAMEPVSSFIVPLISEVAALTRVLLDLARVQAILATEKLPGTKDYAAIIKDITRLFAELERHGAASAPRPPTAGELIGPPVPADILERAQWFADHAEEIQKAAEAMRQLRNATRPDAFIPSPAITDEEGQRRLEQAFEQRRGGANQRLKLLVSQPVEAIKAAFSPSELAVPVAAFQEFLASITDSASIMANGLQAVFSGLSSGINAALQGLVLGGRNLRSALVGIFRSMVSEIIAELSRLVAAKVFQIFLSLIGIPVPSIAISAPIAPIGELPVPPIAGARPVGGGLEARSSRGGDTYNITAISARDVLESLTSPGGPFRRANDRLAELAA